MAPASNEEQFKFLISCIRYSNNGKVDFGQVAKECKIVSKGAAWLGISFLHALRAKLTVDRHRAKRYERMMKSHGIASNAASVKPAPSRSTMKNERCESGSSAPKKRKTDAYLDEANAADDEEGGYASNIKAENESSGTEQFMVKEEDQQISKLSLDEATTLMQYYDSPGQYSFGAEGCHIAEDTYNRGEYGAVGGPRYAASTSMSNAYGMQNPQQYDFSLPYESTRLGSISTSKTQGMSYQPIAQYSTKDQGQFESPVILE